MASPADTIFALSSAAGRAGIAVVRISGPKAAKALKRLGVGALKPRVATRAEIRDPDTNDAIDRGLVLWFPKPNSFTGEDVAELHLHGGRAIVDAALAALARIGGVRPAEPGEFTRRAFDNEKLDLTQVEALADLIDAETESQRRQALRQYDGALTRLYDGWRAGLIKALAHLEAAIDFPDEDLPPDVVAEVNASIARLMAAIDAHLSDFTRGERIRDGVSVVILGPPNAGKSSLLNWLARRDAAIVAPTPGTTRDVIEVHLDLAGHAAMVADTAGLRDAKDAIEDEGIRRARARAERADVKIVLFDGAVSGRDPAAGALIDARTIVAVSKADLLDQAREMEIDLADDGVATHFISTITGFGLDVLLRTLTTRVSAIVSGSDAPPPSRERHRRALIDCREALARAAGQAEPELAAEDLRQAARALGRITGRIEVEELLDAVFRDFCIGK